MKMPTRSEPSGFRGTATPRCHAHREIEDVLVRVSTNRSAGTLLSSMSSVPLARKRNAAGRVSQSPHLIGEIEIAVAGKTSR